MGWLDRVPTPTGDLYIGGLYSLRRREAVETAKITHVVSVMRYEFQEDQLRGFVHLSCSIDDDESENILEFLPTTNKFIKDALDSGGSVLVHCAMGKSRSATVVIAYLMRELGLSPIEALRRLRESRGVCEPNSGFMEQLRLYESMDNTDDLDAHPIYQRWLYQRELDASRACGLAPEADKIRFEDEHEGSAEKADVDLRCRKCRRPLATSQYFVPHTSSAANERESSISAETGPQATCAHYFIDALSWMRPELEQGKLEGRLECPKCSTNVGKYAWQGMQCSCGYWVVPGISLAKGKVDQINTRNDANPSTARIRLPPGTETKKPVGHL